MYTSQRATALFRLRDLICRVFQSVNDMSVCCWHFSETKIPTPLFKQHMSKAINQYNFHKVRLTGSAFLTNALLLRLNNNHSLRAARWNAHLILFQISDVSIFCATRIAFCHSLEFSQNTTYESANLTIAFLLWRRGAARLDNGPKLGQIAPASLDALKQV